MSEVSSTQNQNYSLAICGLPRSGTTWMHNAVIASGKWVGIPADDLSTKLPPVFATDENTTLHESLFRAEVSGDSGDLAAASDFLGKSRDYWCRQDLLNKSPYFCFFLNSLYRSGAADKIVFVKRSIDAVAASMMRHPHIGNILDRNYSASFDFARKEFNIETEHVDAETLKQTRSNYEKLPKSDRALFKCLCFTSSFVAKASGLSSSVIQIIDFDRFDEPSVHGPLFAWMMLSRSQSSTILKAFRRPVLSHHSDLSSEYARHVKGKIDASWIKLEQSYTGRARIASII